MTPQTHNHQGPWNEHPKSPKIGLLLAFVAIGMIAVQLLKTNVNPISATRKPGPERGDLRLENESLPYEIGTWRKLHFTPAPSPESLSEGQVAWTHSWTFQHDQLVALVSFDQADFRHWHDLCVCYEGIGWTVDARESRIPAEDNFKYSSESPKSHSSELERDWPYVIARLSKTNATSSLLVFSLFFDDGDPVDARVYQPAGSTQDAIGRLFQSRFDQNRRSSNVASLRQCQVIVPYSGDLTQDDEARIIELHLKTREAFRIKWLDFGNTKVLQSDGNNNQ